MKELRKTFPTGNELVMKKHPQANIVFQQRKVPNDVEVTHVLYDDSENFSYFYGPEGVLRNDNGQAIIFGFPTKVLQDSLHHTF